LKSFEYESLELSSSHALLFYINNLAQKWTFTNPYFLSLQALLLNQKEIKIDNLRTQRLFHFLAKIIIDEINLDRTGVQDTIKTLKDLMDNFSNNKRSIDGEKIIHSLFLINILNIFNYKIHYNVLNIESIKNILKLIETENKSILNMKIVLCKLYSIEYNYEIIINNDYDLILSLLYDRICLSHPDTRNERTLIDFYLKQKELEDKDIFSSISDNSKGRVLEIALILKAIVGKGLYLPEIEKDQYLSTYAKNALLPKYYQIIDKMNQIVIRGIKVPVWGLIFLYFIIEIFIFSFPLASNSIAIPYTGIEIPLDYIRELPITYLTMLNAVIICSYLYFREYVTKKQMRDSKW